VLLIGSSLGVVFYELFSGFKLFACNNEDNLDEDDMIQLYHFTNEFKIHKLSKIADIQARNLVSQMLSRDCSRRPLMSVILAHPFLSGGKLPFIFSELV
jgi:serine/threonine protein kinase